MNKNLTYYLKNFRDLTPAVVGYMLKGDEILLGERLKVSHGLGKNLVAGIGGKVEEGETHDQALIREFKEEIVTEPIKFTKVGEVSWIFPHKPKWSMKGVVYTVEEWEREPEETEVVRPLWYKTDQLPKEQMWEDNMYWLEQALLGKNFEAAFLFDDDSNISEYWVR